MGTPLIHLIITILCVNIYWITFFYISSELSVKEMLKIQLLEATILKINLSEAYD